MGTVNINIKELFGHKGGVEFPVLKIFKRGHCPISYDSNLNIDYKLSNNDNSWCSLQLRVSSSLGMEISKTLFRDNTKFD